MKSFKTYLLIVESFKDAQTLFSAHNDPEIVAQTLKRFKSLVDSHRIDPEYKDITQWMKQPFQKFQHFVDQQDQEPSKRQSKKQVKGDSIPLDNFGDWIALIPLSKGASCYYGKGTKWCTAATKSNNYFDSYFDQGITLVYFINANTQEKYAMAIYPDSNQVEYFDDRDNSISFQDLIHDLNIDQNKLVSIIQKARHHEGIDDFKENKIKTEIQKTANKILSLKNKTYAYAEELRPDLGELKVLLYRPDLTNFLTKETIHELNELKMKWIADGTELKANERKAYTFKLAKELTDKIESFSQVDSNNMYIASSINDLKDRINRFLTTEPAQSLLPKDVLHKLTTYANTTSHTR